MKNLLLVMSCVLTLSKLLMFQAQTKSSVTIGHLSLTAVSRSELLLADVSRLGQ